jgi:alcohol dehydrogenase class IV
VLPVLPYTEPRIMSRCEDIADVLIFEKAASVLVVTDVGIVKNKLLLPVEEALKKSNVNYVIYDRMEKSV